MENIYYNAPGPGSFGSFDGLRRQRSISDVSDNDIRRFLSEQPTYTLHRNVQRKFRRRRVFSKGINDLFQIDLVDLSSLAPYNDNYRYLLTCIDVFSKVAQVIPVKTKNASAVRDAFSMMLLDRQPNFLQTDKGTEFLNAIFQRLLADNNIRHYTSENTEIKCAVVERFNRTLMTKLFRYFTYKNTRRYLDVLPDIVKSYNSTYHRSIKMAPNRVNLENEDIVRSRLYPPKPKKVKYKFKLNDVVRLSNYKQAFSKGYTQKWTIELFKIAERHPTDPPTYSVEDYAGERIKGKFYSLELQKVRDTGLHRVEKILKTRNIVGGKKEHFVQWEGWPEKFNSWIKAEDVEHLR